VLLAKQHEVDGAFTCVRGPSTRHVTGAVGMKMCVLREQCHEQERCTVGGCSRQSNRDAARARSWHSLRTGMCAGSRRAILSFTMESMTSRGCCARPLLGVLYVRGGRVDRTYSASDGAGAEDRRRHCRHRPGDGDVESIGFDTVDFPDCSGM